VASRLATIVALVPTHDIWRGGAFFEAADEHGNIRALTTAIGVQFVEDKIAQSVRPGGGQQTLVIRADKEQFRHDVVGE
jgi:hypothetical protein